MERLDNRQHCRLAPLVFTCLVCQVILWNPVNGSQLHSMDMDNAVVSASFWRSCLVVSTAMVTVLDLERVGWKLELNAAEVDINIFVCGHFILT